MAFDPNRSIVDQIQALVLEQPSQVVPELVTAKQEAFVTYPTSTLFAAAILINNEAQL